MKTVPSFFALLAASVLFHGFLTAEAAAPRYTVTFDQPKYSAVAGKPSVAKVIISPVPENGLFSYGIQVTLSGGNVQGQAFVISVPAALDFDTVRGPGARLSQNGRAGIAKGSVDSQQIPLQPHREAVIATLDIVGLPRGTYTLSVAPKNDLGSTEQIFVDGLSTNLDPLIKFGSAKLVVAKGETLAGPILLNRQTGLFEQSYRLVNSFDIEHEGLRVYLDNLPAGVMVWNAWNIRFDLDGRPYVVYDGSLAPGEAVNLTIEYHIPGRRILPKTVFTVALPGEDEFPLPQGAILVTTAGKRLSNGQVLVEFTGEMGEEYFIQYSYDSESWQTVIPSVLGFGDKQQWSDNGPPKTESHPKISPPRLYRVVKAR